MRWPCYTAVSGVFHHIGHTKPPFSARQHAASDIGVHNNSGVIVADRPGSPLLPGWRSLSALRVVPPRGIWDRPCECGGCRLLWGERPIPWAAGSVHGGGAISSEWECAPSLRPQEGSRRPGVCLPCDGGGIIARAGAGPVLTGAGGAGARHPPVCASRWTASISRTPHCPRADDSDGQAAPSHATPAYDMD